ncbi:MAG: YigZ family protein [Chitinophagaceae bacterium]
MDHYFTIEKPSQAEFKDRGSKFIAYAFPVLNTVDFKNRLQELKKEHSKAAHHCFAYRIGSDGNVFRVSDDGEPAGTGGKPILSQLDSKSIINTAVIVVRYFGGTLLGVPGLINAYKTATTLALQLTPIIQKQIEIIYSVEFDYTQMNTIITKLKQFNCTILKQEMQLFCCVKIGVPKNRESEVIYSLKELKGVEMKVV